jgi:peptidoglycan hydrolase-like protein with peptidoglycan-binding domain
MTDKKAAKKAPAKKTAQKSPAVDKQPAVESPDSPRYSALTLQLRHTLSQGDIGGQVMQTQDRLVELGFDGFRMDGRFGQMMSKAVRRFQDSRGLKITGEVNGPTWEALFSQESK